MSNCYPHIIRENSAPTDPPPASGIHWIDESTGMEYFSIGTTSVSDWLPRQVLIREKLYCNQITAQLGITDSDTILILDNEAINTNNTVMDCSTPGEIVINKDGLFELDIRITADTADGARRTSETRLQRDGGGGWLDVPQTEGSSKCYGYHRNNASGENTSSSKILINVTSGDKFRYIIKCLNNGGQIDTVPAGTSVTVKEM